MSIFTRVGRIVSAPIRIPIEQGTQKVMQLLVLAALRNGLKLLGLVGVLSDSQLNEYAGAVMLVGGLTWTVIKEWRAHRTAAAK